MSANEHIEIQRAAIDKMLRDHPIENACEHDTIIHFMKRAMDDFRMRHPAGTKAHRDESLLLIGKLRGYAESAGSRRASLLEMGFTNEIWSNTGG